MYEYEWLALGLLAYFSFAVSSSIDKQMTNKDFHPVDTSIVKMFFDALILLGAGIALFTISLTFEGVVGGSFLGVLYGFSSVIYYRMLSYLDAQVAIPASQSGNIILVTILAIPFFAEVPTIINIIGVIGVIIGIFIVLDGRVQMASKRKGFYLLLFVVAIGTTHTLLVKQFLHSVQPIVLSTVMYFSATVSLVLYRRYTGESFKSTISMFSFRETGEIFVAAVFGALGTILLFTAIMIGEVSKVYTLSGTQSAFIFILSILFLDEKFSIRRGLGIILVFVGISLVSF